MFTYKKKKYSESKKMSLSSGAALQFPLKRHIMLDRKKQMFESTKKNKNIRYSIDTQFKRNFIYFPKSKFEKNKLKAFVNGIFYEPQFYIFLTFYFCVSIFVLYYLPSIQFPFIVFVIWNSAKFGIFVSMTCLLFWAFLHGIIWYIETHIMNDEDDLDNWFKDKFLYYWNNSKIGLLPKKYIIDPWDQMCNAYNNMYNEFLYKNDPTAKKYILAQYYLFLLSLLTFSVEFIVFVQFTYFFFVFEKYHDR